MRSLKSHLMLGGAICAAIIIALTGALWANMGSMLDGTAAMREAADLLAQQGRGDIGHDAIKADVMHELVRRAQAPDAPTRRAAFVENCRELRESVQAIAANRHAPQAALAATRAMPLVAHYIASGQRIFDAPPGATNAAEIAAFDADYEHLVAHLGGIGALVQARIAGVAAATERSAGHSRVFAIVAVGIALVGIAVVWLPIRRVMSRLRVLLAAVEQVSRDHTDLTNRVEVGAAADEVGATAKAFNLYLESLRQVISDITVATTRLHTSVGNMSSIATEAASRSHTMAERVSVVSESVEAMDGSARDVAGHARESARSSDETDLITVNGERVVQESIRAMDGLVANVDRATQTIALLNVESERVGSVVQVIRDIAEQTSLLALNAAIEAARAGENGRGFAVVAGEVRNLAARTHDSTSEITQIIGRLQQQVRQVVTDMETGLATTQDCQRHASAAGESFARIRGAIATIAQLNRHVTGAAEGQSGEASSIRAHMREVNELTANTQQLAMRILEAASTAADVAESLEHSVTRFRTASSLVELF